MRWMLVLCRRVRRPAAMMSCCWSCRVEVAVVVRGRPAKPPPRAPPAPAPFAARPRRSARPRASFHLDFVFAVHRRRNSSAASTLNRSKSRSAIPVARSSSSSCQTRSPVDRTRVLVPLAVRVGAVHAIRDRAGLCDGLDLLHQVKRLRDAIADERARGRTGGEGTNRAERGVEQPRRPTAAARATRKTRRGRLTARGAVRRRSVRAPRPSTTSTRKHRPRTGPAARRRPAARAPPGWPI